MLKFNYCCRLFKKHLAWGTVAEFIMTLSIGQLKSKAKPLSEFVKLIGFVCRQSTFHSLLSPAPSLHWLDPRPEWRFSRKHRPQAAYRQTGATTKAKPTVRTRRPDRRSNGVFRTGHRCFLSRVETSEARYPVWGQWARCHLLDRERGPKWTPSLGRKRSARWKLTGPLLRARNPEWQLWYVDTSLEDVIKERPLHLSAFLASYLTSFSKVTLWKS